MYEKNAVWRGLGGGCYRHSGLGRSGSLIRHLPGSSRTAGPVSLLPTAPSPSEVDPGIPGRLVEVLEGGKVAVHYQQASLTGGQAAHTMALGNSPSTTMSVEAVSVGK